MKQITFIAVAIFIATTMTACGQTNRNTQNAPEDWRTFETREFSIQYPANFELDTSGQMGTSLFLFVPQSAHNALFRENFNLVIQDLREFNMSLDDFVTLSESQIEQFVENGNLIESKRVGTDHFLTYTGRQGGFDLKWFQRFTIQNERAYILTFTARQSRFDNYIEVAIKIMDSFKFR